MINASVKEGFVQNYIKPTNLEVEKKSRNYGKKGLCGVIPGWISIME